MLSQAIEAAKELAKENIKAVVIDMHTIKPLDEELTLAYAKKTGAIVTCENAQMIGGLGGAVSEFLSGTAPTIVRRVGVQDLFGEVGQLDYLIDRFELTPDRIVQEAKKAISLK
jgi:transketolase